MSFLDKLKRIVSKNDEISAGEVESLKSDRRYNERIGLAGCNIVHVKLGSRSFSLVDVSYGGVGIFLSQEDLRSLNIGEMFHGEIVAATGQVSCGFESARFGKDPDGRTIGGLVFHHESRKSLIFLRDIVEPLRQGATLGPIGSSSMSKEKTEQGVSYFRGAGPCDLSIFNGQTFTLTFPLTTGQYGELRLRDGKLTTSITVADAGNSMAAHQIAETQSLNLEILQQGSLILMGASANHRDVMMPLLDNLQTKFDHWRSKQSA